ncbi:MAG: hypothetical protein HPY73_05660 [Methanomassiliicoccales archaeon]|nr:MAG: hypothetical protein HPY73_05660 [Methanomassiliicoccales archaeon]
MKVTAKVKKLDENLAYRSTHIRVGSEKTIISPICATTKGVPASEVTEIYRNYTKDGLTRAVNNFDEEKRLNSELKSKKTDNLNICFVDYNDSAELEKEEFELLMDLQYQNSDIAMTPIWSGLIKTKQESDALLETVLAWNKKAIEIIETLNNKSIMGTLSMGMPRTMIGDVINSYVDQGVTLFAIDARNKFVDGHDTWMRDVVRKIKDYKMFDETCLYMVNPRAGNFSHNAEIVLARDFLSSGYGFDILGGGHIPNKGIGLAKNKMKEPFCRRFDEKTYGYIKVPEKEAAESLKVSPSQVKDEMKKYNMTRQADEAFKIAEMLLNESTLESYLKTKDMVKGKHLEHMKKYKKELFEDKKKRSEWFV